MWPKELLVVALRVAGVVVFLHGAWALCQVVVMSLVFRESDVLTSNPWVVQLGWRAAYCALGVLLALGAKRIATWFYRDADEVATAPPVVARELHGVARYVLGLYAIILSVEPLVLFVRSLFPRPDYGPSGTDLAALGAVAAYWLFAAVLLTGPGRVGVWIKSFGRSLTYEPHTPSDPEEGE